MEFCVSDEVEYKGALVRVEAYVSSSYLCNRVREALSSRSLSEALSIVREHGGCRVVSNNPLIIESCDDEIRVVARPGNLVARLGWGRAVSMANDYCGGC